MEKARIAVLVSGGGTNLQALLDAQSSGVIHSGEIVLVISNQAGAYALERAARAGVRAVTITRKDCDGREAFAKLDMSAYSKKVFGMFAGEAETVRLRFSNHLAGAVIDRFGRDVMLIREDDEHFSVSIEAVVSPQFYAWVFGFGAEAEILSPAKVREGMAEMAREVTEQYKK